MKKILICLLAGLAFSASAAVVQSLGSGSALQYSPQYSSDFELNTSLSNNYSEGGLLFSYVGSDNNAGCGFAAVDCEANPGDGYSASFSGNYMGTSGSGAYISIKSSVRDLTAIEFAAESGFNTIFGIWQTFNDTVMTGTGKFNLGPAGVGGVVGLSDAAGFDEVRYFAYDAEPRRNTFSAPAIDSVRAFAVPEPDSLTLLAAAAFGLLIVRRRKS